MEIEGKIRRYSKGGPPNWVVRVPLLDIYTQGHTRKEALKMLKGAIRDYFDYFFDKESHEDVEISIIDTGKSDIGVSCSNLSLLMSLILIKQREKRGVSIRQVVHYMGGSSPNAYKQYEYGKRKMSTEKFDALIHAVNPHARLIFRVL